MTTKPFAAASDIAFVDGALACPQHFECEHCFAAPVLGVSQHKGRTFLEWRAWRDPAEQIELRVRAAVDMAIKRAGSGSRS